MPSQGWTKHRGKAVLDVRQDLGDGLPTCPVKRSDRWRERFVQERMESTELGQYLATLQGD